MSTGDHDFRPATTDTGGAVRRRRHIGDRQHLARRLLFAASETAFDADLDIDWDAPPRADKNWLPAHRVSIYGTALWRGLTPEQQRELGKQELASILSAGIYAQSIMSMLLFRDIVEGQGLVDDRTRFTLASINDESRSTTMFSRLVDKAGATPYRLPPGVQQLTRFTLWTPAGPLGRGFRLLLEEMLDSILRDIAADPDIQPHVAQLTKMHAVAGARHIEFTRDDVIHALEENGPVVNALHRWVLAVITASVYAVVVNPRVYRSVGINPARGVLAALASDNYGRNARRATRSFRHFARDEGLLAGPVAATILRLGRVG